METVTAYRVGTLLLPTLEEAQIEALAQIVESALETANIADDCDSATAKEVAKALIAKSAEVVAILGVAPEPVPKQRKTRRDAGIKRGPKVPKAQAALGVPNA